MGGSKTYDEGAGAVSEFCRVLQITVHVRGDDSRPVIEYKDKFTGRVVGGIELKKRIKAYRALLPKIPEEASGGDGPEEGRHASQV